MPNAADLRRVWPFHEAPRVTAKTPDVARIVAHHEAAHVIVAQWCGLDVREAESSDQGGFMQLALDQPLDDQDAPPPAEGRPLAACMLAAMCHAGVIAELLLAGRPLKGVTARMGSQDWENACRALSLHFAPGLAGHGYAQRIALHVLSDRWDRVQQLADHLLECGNWSPSDDLPLAA